MNTINTVSTSPAVPVKSSFSLAALIATLFALNLREKLDADTGGDKSDAAYTWGM